MSIGGEAKMRVLTLRYSDSGKDRGYGKCCLKSPDGIEILLDPYSGSIHEAFQSDLTEPGSKALPSFKLSRLRRCWLLPGQIRETRFGSSTKTIISTLWEYCYDKARWVQGW